MLLCIQAQLLCIQAQAGEIIVKVPQEKMAPFFRMIGLVNRLFGESNPGDLSRENLDVLANVLLPRISHGKVSTLKDLQATVVVMKDGLIVQIPDALLRERVDDAQKWCRVYNKPWAETSKVEFVCNTLVEESSWGFYGRVADVPAEVEIRFDDPKYARD